MEATDWFPEWLYKFAIPPACWGCVPLSLHPCQYVLSLEFLTLVFLIGIMWNLRVIMICISLMIEYFFKCFSAIQDSSVENFVSNYMINFGEFSVRCWEADIFFCLNVKCSLDICFWKNSKRARKFLKRVVFSLHRFSKQYQKFPPKNFFSRTV